MLYTKKDLLYGTKFKAGTLFPSKPTELIAVKYITILGFKNKGKTVIFNEYSKDYFVNLFAKNIRAAKEYMDLNEFLEVINEFNLMMIEKGMAYKEWKKKSSTLKVEKKLSK